MWHSSDPWDVGSWLVGTGTRNIMRGEHGLWHQRKGTSSSHNCQYFSTGERSYSSTDLTKLSDLLEFLVARCIPENDIKAEPAFKLSSDHSPVITTICASTLNKTAFPTLTTNHTHWDVFRAYINELINLHLHIKERAELDDAKLYFTTLLQEDAWYSTPTPRARTKPVNNIPLHTREIHTEKRHSSRRRQWSRNKATGIIYNRLKSKLRTALRYANNATFEHYLTSVSPSDNTLWKASKRHKRPHTSIPPIWKANGCWAMPNV